MATNYNLLPIGDYRNEGWTLVGSGVSNLYQAWSSTDDTKYCKSPASKGRAATNYPIDISTANIPSGASITSVTFFIRANKTSSASTSLTVNVLSKDDTSKFYTRTLNNLTTSIQTLEVGTYKVDPLGRAWTRHTLNQMIMQVFSYTAVADCVRVYRVYAQVNFHSVPTATVTYPTGTVYTPTPVLVWNYQQPEGDIQKTAEYKIYTSAQQQVASFNPDVTTPLYRGTVEGDRTTITSPYVLTPDSYYLYVRVTSTLGAVSAWNGRGFSVRGASPGSPAPNFAGVGTGGAGGFVSVVPSNDRCSAFLTLRDGSNLLSVQQADFETITDSLGYTATNCATAQNTATFFGSGGGSMSLTASSAATMSVQSSFLEVAPSTPITAVAQFRTAVTARTVNVRVLFFDETFTAVSGTITTAGTSADATTTWTQVACTGTTPSTVTYAQVQLEVVSPANAEVHYVDGVGLMYGANTPWSHGGHMSRNMLSSYASDADDPQATTASWVAKTATTYSVASTAGTGSEGAKAFKMLYAGLSPTISRVNTGTVYSSTSAQSTFTLNKPASVADGDVLVAYVATDAGTCIPPTGWTLMNGTDSGGPAASTMSVMMRDGLAADPSTWTGTTSVTNRRIRAVVVAYRGAAPIASQLVAQAITTSLGGALTLTTPGVTNSSSNAWRLSAFSWRDDVTGGSTVANIVAPSVQAISYVGSATTWSSTGSGNLYTINRPSGVVSGDLMIATLSVDGTVTVTPPSGWTLVRSQNTNIGNGNETSGTVTSVILKRTAGGSEPTAWAGTHTATNKPKISQCSAYRNCADASLQFIAENGTVNDGNGVTLTNTDANAWRIFVTAASTPNQDNYSNEISTRSNGYSGIANSQFRAHAGMYDSNGPVATGSHNRRMYGSVFSGATWMGIIKPLSSAPGAGANETELTDGVAGAADGYLYLNMSVYDSNAVAASGVGQTVTGVFTPGSGTSINSSAGWIGYLLPAAGVTSGQAGVTLADWVDISSVDQAVIDRVGGQVTAQAAFLGSISGTPIIGVDFYVGNELLVSKTASGTSFGTSAWVKSSATFDVPEATTRLKMNLYINDCAVNDYALFDRVSLGFGNSTVWRRGTGRAAHPIFSMPLIEYREDRGDGYSDWASLPGSESALLTYDQLSGLIQFEDQSVTPLAPRMYRARTMSFGLAGDAFVSEYGANSDEVTVRSNSWWLKDPDDGDASIKLEVSARQPLPVDVPNSAVTFQPLGADLPIVVTQGFKGDTIKIVAQVGHDDWAKLRKLLEKRKTLILQSNLDDSWWVRSVGPMQPSLVPTQSMFDDPLRFVALTFVQVDPVL